MAQKREPAVARVAELRYWRARDAQVVVDAWRRSGEAVGAFAERYGLRPRRVQDWARQLDGGEEAVPFHPVQVVAPDGVPRTGGGGESIEIVLQDSCSVRVPPGFAAEDLTRVLSVLAVEVGVRC